MKTLGPELRRRLATSPQAALPIARAIRDDQEHLFPPAAHLLNAEDDRQRAVILLQVPDGMVVTHGKHLVRACLEAGFQTGADYLQVRLAALLARRETDGRLPEPVAAPLLYWRAWMVARTKGGTAR